MSLVSRDGDAKKVGDGVPWVPALGYNAENTSTSMSAYKYPHSGPPTIASIGGPDDGDFLWFNI
jgi:hypothetical protein